MRVHPRITFDFDQAPHQHKDIGERWHINVASFLPHFLQLAVNKKRPVATTATGRFHVLPPGFNGPKK